MSKTLAKIQVLEQQTEKIKEAFATLQQRLTVAETEKLNLENKVNVLNPELDNEKQRYKVLTMAKSFTNDTDKTKARSKVNEFIREIDKCIALLNK